MEHWGGVRSQLVSQPPETKAPAALDRVTWKRAWVGYVVIFVFLRGNGDSSVVKN